MYIVELSWIPFDDQNQILKSLPINRDPLNHQSKSIEIPSTIEDEVIEIAEQDYGLICPSSGQLVPLKAFHIRSQLVDITAEVNPTRFSPLKLLRFFRLLSIKFIITPVLFPSKQNTSFLWMKIVQSVVLKHILIIKSSKVW